MAILIPEDEIRWKYSALQITSGDLDRIKGASNQIYQSMNSNHLYHTNNY